MFNPGIISREHPGYHGYKIQEIHSCIKKTRTHVKSSKCRQHRRGIHINTDNEERKKCRALDLLSSISGRDGGQMEEKFKDIVSTQSDYYLTTSLFEIHPMKKAIVVCPFGMSEFKRRVEVLKHAIMLEMDEENATDMDKYNLAKRRNAYCKSMLKSDEEKAARIMGILGFV
ncbi:hypothetical protein OS493_029076 [Desmophyllum pertusum]|uniref:Uncharacterized protein n=1 Tax=Desmophyllum pertusum TaxID=174260 RepID=A0A9W9YN78_9CNID|nr:hypothetical protein OS493_029076 [Desmophyllum pertusum]